MSPRTGSGDDPLVDRIGTAVYTVSTDAPEGDGTLAWTTTMVVVVQVGGGGTTGLGHTYGAAATAHVVEQLLAGVVTGRCAGDVPAANEAMNMAVRNVGRPGLIAGAVSAVDIALWDVKARLLDLPLTRPLGASRTDMPVYGSGGFTTYDERRLDRQLRHWTEEQEIPRLKIKIGESWGRAEGRDRERIAQARRSVGDATDLYVDANGAYGRKQAVRMARHLDEHGVTWFEEPVSSDDLGRPATDPGNRRIRGDRRGIRLHPRLLRPHARCRSRGLPSGRRHPLRRTHRLAARGSARGSRRTGTPVTALRTFTRTRRPRSPTCAIWSGSTTTYASRTSSSTEPSTPTAAASARGPTTHPATV